MALGSRLPKRIAERLSLPLVAAPMLRVSGPEIVTAACREGVIGAFPTANARSTDELDHWLVGMKRSLAECDSPSAPICPNLIIQQPRLKDDLACLVRHRVELVITSVGSPAAVIPALHDVGAQVWADVATLKHAHKAIEAGVDGLVLLSAGAGGQTGALNPFAFVRAVRGLFAGVIVLAGGISDGIALRAAEVLGCDLAYMGTRFIATTESLATSGYRQLLVDSTMDDVMLTRAFTGLNTSMLRPSIRAAGLDPERLDEQVSRPRADELFSAGSGQGRPRRWVEICSAGHSVSGVRAVQSVAELIGQTLIEYRSALGN